ncbi:hypothetical protein [Streptomyces sp. NPDC048248]
MSIDQDIANIVTDFVGGWTTAGTPSSRSRSTELPIGETTIW